MQRLYIILISLLATLNIASAAAPIRDARLIGEQTELTGTLTLKSGASIVAATGSIINFADGTLTLGPQQIPWSAINPATGAFGGDTGTGGSLGLVPAPTAGDAAAGKFLSAAGVWEAPLGQVSDVAANQVFAGPESGPNSTPTWRALVADDLPVMIGATSSISGVAGAVPAPGAGADGLYLRGDGTWSTVGTSLATLSDVALTTPAINQILSYDGDKWVNTSSIGGGLTDPTTTTGDLIVRDSSGVNRLPVGADNTVLMADSSAPAGLSWQPASGGARDHARLRRSTNVPIPSASLAFITFDVIDYDNNHIAAPGGGKVVIKRPGLYFLTGTIIFSGNPNGERAVNLHRGSARIATFLMPATTVSIVVSVATVVPLLAGDELQISGWQNSGSALTMETSEERAPLLTVLQLTD